MDPYGKSLADNLDRVEMMQMTADAPQRSGLTAEPMQEVKFSGPAANPFESGEAMTESNVLLLNWQVEALESVAFSRGVTTAYLLRRLIRNCIEGLNGAWTPQPDSGTTQTKKPSARPELGSAS
jgi:hypothetical protein